MRRLGTIAGWGVMTFMLTGCGANLVKMTEDFSFDAAWDGYERCIVRTSNGHVTLVTDDREDIHISGTKRAGGLTRDEARENLAQLTIVAAADESDPATFVIELQVPELLRRKSPGASFDIRVPASCAADIRTGNGAVQVRGLKDCDLKTSNGGITAEQIDGRVEAHTSNGTVQAVFITGDLRVDTNNGRIIVDTIEGDCDLETSNGRIEVRKATGNLQAETSNGRITAQVTPPPTGEVILETSNGSIMLELPATLEGTLRLRTSNGRVETDFNSVTLTDPRWSKHFFEAQLNEGGPGRFEVHTSNGSIVLRCR